MRCPHGQTGGCLECAKESADAVASSLRRDRKLQVDELKSNNARIVQELLEKEATIAKLREELNQYKDWSVFGDEEDSPIPEDEQIRAAHPMQTKQHKLYEEAMRLVGAKKSKFALVSLVNWLLAELAEAKADIKSDELAEKTILMIDDQKQQQIERLERVVGVLARVSTNMCNDTCPLYLSSCRNGTDEACVKSIIEWATAEAEKEDS